LECRLTRSPHFFLHSVPSVWSFNHNPKLISLRSILNLCISIPLVYYWCVCYVRLFSCAMTVLLMSAVRNTKLVVHCKPWNIASEFMRDIIKIMTLKSVVLLKLCKPKLNLMNTHKNDVRKIIFFYLAETPQEYIRKSG
jgi:hypothetical protein